MSRENVEVVRQVYAAIEQGDRPGFGMQRSDAMEAFITGVADPAIEWVPFLVASTEGRRYHGHAGLRQWARDMEDVWEYLNPELQELHDAGEHVVAVVRFQGRGRVSGAEAVEVRGQVWTVENGTVTRMVAYEDPQQALEAVGLSG